MAQHVVNSHRVLAVLGELGPHRGHRHVVVEYAELGQDMSHCRGDALRGRGRPEQGVGLHQAARHIGQSARGVHNQPPAVYDRDLDTKLCPGIDPFVHGVLHASLKFFRCHDPSSVRTTPLLQPVAPLRS
jgi:hypothetical protein